MSHLGDFRTSADWLQEAILQLKYLDSIQRLVFDILNDTGSWKVDPELRNGTIDFLLSVHEEKYRKIVDDLEDIHGFIYARLDKPVVYLDREIDTTAPIGKVVNE